MARTSLLCRPVADQNPAREGYCKLPANLLIIQDSEIRELVVEAFHFISVDRVI